MLAENPVKRLMPSGSRLRNTVRAGVFGALCFATRVTAFGKLPEPPHRDAAVCRVVRGDLRGSLLAHPRFHTSPSFALGLFEPHIAEALAHFCRPGDVIYDVGANIGYHALLFARYVGATGQVIAFEPNPSDNKSLRWNLAVNGVANIKVYDAALSDAPGRLAFAVFAEPGVHHLASDNEPADAELIQVEAHTVDQVVFEHGNRPPAFIKIDVEGAELRVLKGAQRVLHEFQPIVTVEVWPNTHSQVVTLMADAGYKIHLTHQLYGVVEDIVFIPINARESR